MNYISIIGSFALLWCTGCVSLVEKAGQALDGSAFAEKKTAVYRGSGIEIAEMQNKAAETSVVIMLEQFPAMKLRTSAPDENNIIYLTAMDYLGGNTHGWNEYRLDLFGSGKLVLGATSAAFAFSDEIEPVEISSGKIRRYDTRITGTEALSNLRNRRERIVAIAGWMNGREESPALYDQKAFEEYWKPVLFPEMISKRKQPAGWQQEEDRWEKAEDIRWNISYTERVFPEHLWGIRNSGTMLRDWEEAIDWIYIEYEWSRLMRILAVEITIPRVQK